MVSEVFDFHRRSLHWLLGALGGHASREHPVFVYLSYLPSKGEAFGLHSYRFETEIYCPLAKRFLRRDSAALSSARQRSHAVGEASRPRLRLYALLPYSFITK